MSLRLGVGNGLGRLLGFVVKVHFDVFAWFAKLEYKSAGRFKSYTKHKCAKSAILALRTQRF